MSVTTDWYLEFARDQVRTASPTYARLSHAVVADDETLAALESLPEQKRQPNLLFAAVRFLGGPVDDPAIFLTWVREHWDAVSATMLARLTQTNETGRCAALLPVLAQLPQPLALLEVGASAGLNLYPDAYHYRYGDVSVGSPASGVHLDCEVSGAVPVPTAMPRIVWRTGLDINPLNVCDDDDVRWLEALVWPEQEYRRTRLLAAVKIARANPPTLVQADLRTNLDALTDLAATAPTGATLVVFHSAVLYYLKPADRSSFMDTVPALPGHWISVEEGPVFGGPPAQHGHMVVRLDGRPIANADQHGATLHWL